jgi:hypothetical protein
MEPPVAMGLAKPLNYGKSAGTGAAVNLLTIRQLKKPEVTRG